MHGPISGGGAELRLFAALHVPNDKAQRLADHADVITATIDGGRVADPATMHLTWAFLGAVPEEYVPAVAQALEMAAREVPGPMLCTARTVSAYGRGRCLAADIDIDLVALLDSARDRFLGATGPYAPQADVRAWRPHVTILRAWQRRGLEHLPPLPSVSWVTPELRLYASLPSPAGRQHRVLHAVPFGAPVPNR